MAEEPLSALPLVYGAKLPLKIGKVYRGNYSICMSRTTHCMSRTTHIRQMGKAPFRTVSLLPTSCSNSFSCLLCLPEDLHFLVLTAIAHYESGPATEKDYSRS
jgi:hypothetical protein